ncbi:hypothetical protein B0H16DRAFT_1805879 [Mycena metata]|uniref:Uncharacterized protein n=1 Tax=Mycena metata TaxID=1033252 RepID=A0AAD7NJL1_9AGAR|nr:hypothetical protein B0H16DRAFT_1805879 [Mycena metata]
MPTICTPRVASGIVVRVSLTCCLDDNALTFAPVAGSKVKPAMLGPRKRNTLFFCCFLATIQQWTATFSKNGFSVKALIAQRVYNVTTLLLLITALLPTFQSPSHNMEPALPLDLERVIFELAASVHFSTIPTLMRVAHRVKHWVEPFLYRVMFVGTSHPTPVAFVLSPRSRSSFYRDAVRHICIDPPVLSPFTISAIDAIFTTCTRIESLAAKSTHNQSIAFLFPFISTFPALTRLHADLTDLLSELPRNERSTAFDAFSNLTHLEMREHIHAPEVCAGLARLPHLTHLALQYNPYARGIVPLCMNVLKECRALRVLAGLSEMWIELGVGAPFYQAIDTPRIHSDDVRFVLVQHPPRVTEDVGAWLSDARSGRMPGFWECAEEAVGRRIAAKSAKKESQM